MMGSSTGKNTENIGLVVAVEMFAVFEGWGQPDEIYDGLPFKLCRYDRYGRRIFVARSGPGQENAEAAARMLIEEFGVSELWNFGVVGGLTPEARVGDIFVVEEVVRWDGCGRGADGAERGRLLGCGARPEVVRVDVPAGAAGAAAAGREVPGRGPLDAGEGALQFKCARLASGNSVVSAHGARVRLAADTGADIVDMEATGIAAAAAAGGHSCFMIKCVSDGLDTDEEMLTADFRETARAAFAAFDCILRNYAV